ncbi:hypothetical protein [Prosthecobacter vanneervenii]|uniref:Uncharacterized protein n=1 Tax=Prosthecobacter vanneervenii TaxID=48466 RepID=A0A7W7YB77_9BACT|nr:hypothetical protein [Prosthecobacter vanneervenii]MBB5033001.1 hypothetical protein [Prosthecobacter vanneervenii]
MGTYACHETLESGAADAGLRRASLHRIPGCWRVVGVPDFV